LLGRPGGLDVKKLPCRGLSDKKHPVGVFSEEPECRSGCEGARLPRGKKLRAKSLELKENFLHFSIRLILSFKLLFNQIQDLSNIITDSFYQVAMPAFVLKN